jgi:hypothetical protein
MEAWMKKIMKIMETCNNKNPKCPILMYEFLGADKMYPVIVSDELSL